MLVASALFIYGVIGFYFLPSATFQGNLTRMGLLPETQFGWRKPQPAIDPKLMPQATLQEADVLVIGDSFSDDRIWQTALTRRGFKVRTESWDTMRGVCGNFMPWLRSQGFLGMYVVLETIELNVAEILKRSVACQQMEIHPSPLANTTRIPPITVFDPEHGDHSGRLSIGILTTLNAHHYAHLSNAPAFKSLLLQNGSKVERVQNGCQLFSHTRCQDALFLARDEASDIMDESLSNLKLLNARLNGITPIWAFVPNKSTTYLYSNKQFWNQAEQHVHAPNLLRMTQQAIQAKTIDLYPANNTHFSTTGYLLMGEEIYKTMQNVAH